MSVVRVIVLRSAGTNCDAEAVHAWTMVGAEVNRLHINALIEHPATLRDAHILTIPGGFSYGDDIAAGRIFARRLRLHLADELRSFVERGRLVLGICNGFQILVQAGLLPGMGPNGPGISLAMNASGRFEDRWVHLEAGTGRTPFLEPHDRFYIPVAHAEGRLTAADAGGIQALHSAGLVALRYVNPAGGPPHYPFNPNGSADAIAGLIDPTGRILGLMPHPERHVDRTQHPYWTRASAGVNDPTFAETGLRIFQRGVAYFR